ncbi:MAG: UDP-N-acetylmuramoyl-L-alanine--D-glutamate ligase [Oscillospiraceae bacterium]|jgi:UDP-N-acetylmuramoylalanine--D-glutamate ligase|nr:UDP-N-acetylmuramoyl-L-alanine--D-glutamate ligase [Oscillospiraceae bacterium]
MNFKFLHNKKIMLLGLGRSNLALAKILNKNSIDFEIRDASEQVINFNFNNSKVKFRFGSDYLKDLDFDIIFRSPGVSYSCQELILARNRGAKISSEIELFFDICPCKICGITGSDGKTTTTTLIYKILKKMGLNVFIGGNIGTPIISKINKIKKHSIAIVELSSFQLISMQKSPQISVITNVSPNHLDVHKDLQDYFQAKFNIIKYQTSKDFIILNFEDKNLRSIAENAKSNVKFFSSKQKANGAFIDQNGMIKIYYKNAEISMFNKNEIKIPGNHNVENFLAAICSSMSICKDCSEKFINSVRYVARNFIGVEHRIEFVDEINGVKFYNDSIASSPTRTIKGALSVFKDNNIILIAGGYDKKLSFHELAVEICKKVKVLVLLGESASKINEAVRKISKKIIIIYTKSMKEAIEISFSNASEGDIILLSPACASFGLYKNFEERGKDFKNIVKKIKIEYLGK